MLTGEKLRFLRQARGMKQWELANKMEITAQRISALENTPKISKEQTQRIFKALKLSKRKVENILTGFVPRNKPKRKIRWGYACLLE